MTNVILAVFLLIIYLCIILRLEANFSISAKLRQQI